MQRVVKFLLPLLRNYFKKFQKYCDVRKVEAIVHV